MILKKIFSKKSKKPTYSRALFIDSIPKELSLLEIGPFYTPLCKGKNVKYLDILDHAALINRARKLDNEINVEQIPYIDYVSPTGDLSVTREIFDAVFSSHVIEHQLDFIGHLQQINEILKQDGKYYLIIPDKRYCFDHFNPLSTIADIINAHIEKRNKHSLKSVIEHRIITHNNPVEHWNGQHGVVDDLSSKIKNAIIEYNTHEYIDVHAWCFTPESFSQIIDLLNQLGYIDLAITRLHPTPVYGIEFYCVLEKNNAMPI